MDTSFVARLTTLIRQYGEACAEIPRAARFSNEHAAQASQQRDELWGKVSGMLRELEAPAVLYVSEEQLDLVQDGPEFPGHGKYLPVRKSAAGLLSFPLYAAPPIEPAEGAPRGMADPFTYIIQHLNSEHETNVLTVAECIARVKKFRDAYNDPPTPEQPRMPEPSADRAMVKATAPEGEPVLPEREIYAVYEAYHNGRVRLDLPRWSYERAIESLAVKEYRRKVLAKAQASTRPSTEEEGEAFTEGYFQGQDETNIEWQKQIDDLRVKVAAFRDDAERYRLITSDPDSADLRAKIREGYNRFPTMSKAAMDAYIDELRGGA